MRLRPTPETDAAEHCIDEIPQFPFVSSNHARKLECERDQYHEQADALVDLLGETQVRMIDAERERDNARAKVEELEAVMRSTERAMLLVSREAKLEQERDEAKGEIVHLERERDEARAETVQLLDVLMTVRRERDEALESISEALTTRIKITDAAKLLSTAIDERDEAREQRDGLATALRNLCDRFLGNKSSRDITDQLVAAGEALATINKPEP